jgi:hypothetical protein
VFAERWINFPDELLPYRSRELVIPARHFDKGILPADERAAVINIEPRVVAENGKPVDGESPSSHHLIADPLDVWGRVVAAVTRDVDDLPVAFEPVAFKEVG